MKLFILLLSFFILSCSTSDNATEESLKIEFKKFFKSDMPNIIPDGSIYLNPKDSNVIPIQGQPVHISVRITVPGLKKLLILHGKNKYPDNVCKPVFKQTFVAGYTFNPDMNISYNLTTMRAECSSNIIVWAQTKNGEFYKTEKFIQIFQHRENI